MKRGDVHHLGVLGSGGFGSVTLNRSAGDNELFAMKLIDLQGRELNSDGNAAKRLENEIMNLR